MKKKTRIKEFEKMHKALTDKDEIEKNKRKKERELRIADKKSDTGL
jgi:hypothetical protein